MSEPDFLADARIAIVGLGLMGGSLALALRDRCHALLGCDLDPATLRSAHQQNLFDKLSPHLAEILPGTDVVILATPVKAILDTIPQLPGLHPGSPIVLDLGSTKVKIAEALNKLPSRFDPLGGHPMCGKETSGFDSADPDLFRGAVFAFTSLERTSSKAKYFAQQITAVLGSKLLWIDPENHDRWTSATSHLPYLVASALAVSTPEIAKPLVGPGFRSTTRIAATPAGIMLDVLESNQENILQDLDRFMLQMNQFKTLLMAGEYPDLESALEEGANQLQKITASSQRGDAS
jgi:prephenate dehydrogenase